MLKDRIVQTIKFFDLQDTPLTLLELHTYLVADKDKVRSVLSDQWEVVVEAAMPEPVNLDQVLSCLESECQGVVETYRGYYFLSGKRDLVTKRLNNYQYGIKREKLIKKFVPLLRYIPFVRGVALGGSQSLGQQKNTSDIDLLIVTDPGFLWLARTLVTGYFQLFGVRRHGRYIPNRFCLNHYIAAPREVLEYKNLYTAEEYTRLRPLVYESAIRRFQYNNSSWIRQLLPNAELFKVVETPRSTLQEFLEKMFTNSFGRWLEAKLKSILLPKIRQDKFIVVRDDELSFHPQSKQQDLLENFFMSA